ncbi:ogr/Delta-like zinc finger family protein [Avibacterium paragallinarum]|uniref:Transcriptional regulator n=2 Tax=Avibacterium paragallinarum TaxID=728 RepID=A0AAE5WGV9_AVIPA|nr:ogr/Delta-like zinc finger family protein [Avibacterium paragallinarum]MEE3608245.1 ogr/Delta-like zinc finger family protein [Avibacterium paragallinarum]MEE3668394.1 ogr/Delta-like zinc finger family protein [Avibacterium paragallinarum]MEE3680404.1 ogr/Delta-like zinc finger family protein [Avibacterium paragallinarum]MEE4385937.1 ogr/Delta-like zinc finger family protein [Avibacterium paragallinarum]PXZ39573.1 transcriptional regulator [Avibacterium paragallinarum]
MARTADIYCNVCNSKAMITRTDRIHSNFSKLYCSCRNSKCGHKFVINQEFSHTTKTSLLTKESLLKLLIGQLSEEDKEKLKQELE